MTTQPPAPKNATKATVDNLAYELCQIKIEARMRDFQRLKSGNSLVISGFVVMFFGLGPASVREFTPFFIGLAMLCFGLSNQRQGMIDHSKQPEA